MGFLTILSQFLGDLYSCLNCERTGDEHLLIMNTPLAGLLSVCCELASVFMWLHMERQMRQKSVYFVNWIVSRSPGRRRDYGIEVRFRERILAFWRTFPRTIPRSIPRSISRTISGTLQGSFCRTISRTFQGSFSGTISIAGGSSSKNVLQRVLI